jgi:hypothetical protein
MEGWKRGGGKGVGEALARLVKKLLQQEQTLEVMHSLIQRLVLESENRISTLPPTVRPSLPPSLLPSPVGALLRSLDIGAVSMEVDWSLSYYAWWRTRMKF